MNCLLPIYIWPISRLLRRTGRARHHVYTENPLLCRGMQPIGRNEMREVLAVTYEQRLCVDARISRIRKLIQSAKRAGLSGGEVHRVDNYCQMMGTAFEVLTHLKEYRTPLAFRSFARVFILMMPALYGPHYVAIGRGLSEQEDNLGMSLIFACSIQLVLMGLFHVMIYLEDPFEEWRSDSVKITERIEVARRQLFRIARETPEEAQDWMWPWMRESWDEESGGVFDEGAEGEGAAGVDGVELDLGEGRMKKRKPGKCCAKGGE